MKCLVIGGNRFVGLRVVHALEQIPGIDLHVINRTGQVAHSSNAVIYKGDRLHLESAHLDRDWDLIYDFACFNERDARAATGFFGKVTRYIYISTASVYEGQTPRKESDYRPEAFDLQQPAADPPTYPDGKRRAEAVFHQQSRFSVLSVRFPMILGPDDYTHRLEFHIDRVKRGGAIYFPNMKARISMISSEDAAKFLTWARDQVKLTGPLNVASAEPIALDKLMAQIELILGKKPLLAAQEKDDNHSPYGAEHDWYMNTEKLQSTGFRVRPIDEWLPGLIGAPDTTRPRFVH